MLMFSGFVCVGMFAAFGSSTLTDCVITGMVIRKMMRSTSITSTRGVVLISDIGFSSSDGPPPVVIDMPMVPASGSPAPAGLLLAAGDDAGRGTLDARAAHDDLLEVVREELHLLHDQLVTAEQV